MDLAKVAAALADPVRISMLELIASPPGQSSSACGDPSDGNLGVAGVCVCEFVQYLKISQPRASYHLKILREAGLVSEEPRGKWSYYGLKPEQVQEFCRRLQRATGTRETRRRN